MRKAIAFFAALHIVCSAGLPKSFSVDYEHGTFMKDGKPFRYTSGSIHYSRVPAAYWKDRLTKMFAAGLDAIQLYIPWNAHQPYPDVFDFSGQNDVEQFIRLAQDVGLLVVLRPGPYICAEWEFGGLPWWLLSSGKPVITRSMDATYIAAVDKWLTVLLPKIKPLLYINGGPIITVQVENEYGSYFACDRDYMQYLKQHLIQFLGTDVVLFTTDGNGLGFLKCGALNGTLTTVDFGTGNATQAFQPLREWQPKGPLVNSEYYVGWLDIWGSPHSQVDTGDIIDTLDQMMKLNASVNMYMFHGGTNFGYTSGAPNDSPFLPVPTSYDYDAPLSEAGDITDKYNAIRNLLGKYKVLPSIPVPQNTTKAAYGPVNMTFVSTVMDCLATIKTGSVTSPFPLTQEQVGQGQGFTLYTHTLQQSCDRSRLSVPGIRDMGYVVVGGQSQGILDRTEGTNIAITAAQGDVLSILVENQGRVNYGSGINRNSKGIIANVTLNGSLLQDWTIISTDMSRASGCTARGSFSPSILLPSVYKGQLNVSRVADTFLRLDGWHKGQVFINGFNVGRYWPIRGPQLTLFIPGTLFREGVNTVTVVELEAAPCSSSFSPTSCVVQFVAAPAINGPVSHPRQRLVVGRHDATTQHI